MLNEFNGLTNIWDTPDSLGHCRDMSQAVGHGTPVGHAGGFPPVGGNPGCPGVCPGGLSGDWTARDCQTKRCLGCETEKDRSQFFPSKATEDGLHTSCIPCAKAAWRALTAERDARRASPAAAHAKTRSRRVKPLAPETSP
jgi:hypothetical protein